MGVSLATDIETRAGRGKPYRARVRWVDPVTGEYPSLARSHDSLDEAEAWITDSSAPRLAGSIRLRRRWFSPTMEI
ncbi:MAG: hypothetical protein QOI21_5585 [Actinomycetota bacterium]|jgi:hypothetical protein|nr:hypothetical protein [Actinomycetota bacterium]